MIASSWLFSEASMRAMQRRLAKSAQTRLSFTVAILAQGTHRAVAVTQAFFTQARFPLLPFFSDPREGGAQLFLGFLPSSVFDPRRRGSPIEPTLNESMPSARGHSLLEFSPADF